MKALNDIALYSRKRYKGKLIAITGADMSPKVDGKSIPLWESIEIKKDATLEMSYATIGARSYIAFSGGINTKPWLGSRSTFHKAGVGGIEGKAIKDDQIIPLNKSKTKAGRKIKKEAITKKADYIAIGAFHKSTTKKTKYKATLKVLKMIRINTKKPIIAIGGINQYNYKKLLLNKADFLAISSFIWKNKKLKPFEAIREIK